MSSFKDITGNRYSRLVVVKEVLPRVSPIKWIVHCDCGTMKEVIGKDLKKGATVSCGCYKIERTKETCTTHGATVGKRSRLYKLWTNMYSRISNPNRDSYKYYGGKGITICNDWSVFSVFSIWALANGYEDSLTIERLDNDLGYCSTNCTWATRSIQARNRGSREGSSSIYVGVSRTSSNKWKARIYVENKNISLGVFTTEYEAAVARDTYVISNNLEAFTLNVLLRSLCV